MLVVNTLLSLASLRFNCGETFRGRDLSTAYKQITSSRSSAGTQNNNNASAADAPSNIVTRHGCAALCANDVLCGAFSFFQGATGKENVCKLGAVLQGHVARVGWRIYSKERRQGVRYGCFLDSASARVLPEWGYSGNWGLTITICINRCRDLGFAFAGTEIGVDCMCGKSLGVVPTQSTGCTTSCPGDPSKTCGAPDRIEVYETGLVN